MLPNHLLVNSPSSLELSANFSRHVILPADEVSEVRRGRPVALPRVTQHGGSAFDPWTSRISFLTTLSSNHPNSPVRHPAKDCSNLWPWWHYQAHSQSTTYCIMKRETLALVNLQEVWLSKFLNNSETWGPDYQLHIEKPVSCEDQKY